MQLPVAIGLDYPNLLHDLLVNGATAPEKDYPIGIRSRNLLLDANNLRKRFIEGRAKGGLHWLEDAGDFLLQPFRWIMGREKPDTISISDPLPAMKELYAAVHRPRAAVLRPKAPIGAETRLSR